MASTEEIRKGLVSSLDEEDALRERTYKLSRDLIRSCRMYISDLVYSERSGQYDGIIESNAEFLDLVGKPMPQRYGFVEDALMELSEAAILTHILDGKGLPPPSVIGVSERAYALGLCDAIGELRRVFLNRLLRNDVKGAREMFTKMEDLFGVVDGLSYPTGMIPLKKKQDMVRGLIDKTAGELSNALYSRGRGESLRGD